MVVENMTAGITREAVERLSTDKGEPGWMRENRLRAWELFESLPMPGRQDEGWRRTDISKLKLENLVPFSGVSTDSVVSPLKLDGSYGGWVTQQNSVTVDRSLQAELADQGVIFTDLDTAVREHPDLVQQHFMTEAVTADYNKFTALNGALWSGGAFLFVPRDVEVTLPFRVLYGLTAGGAGLFTHTIIVLGERSRLTVRRGVHLRWSKPAVG